MDKNLTTLAKELTETVKKHQAIVKGIIDEINKTIGVIGTERFDWDEDHEECLSWDRGFCVYGDVETEIPPMCLKLRCPRLK